MRRTAALALAVSLVALVRPAGAAPADVFVPLTHNLDCIAPAGVLYGDGDCDGQERTLIDDAKTPKAGKVTARGIPFDFPARTTRSNNVAVGVGQTVPVTAKAGYTGLQLLGFMVEAKGSAADRTFTITYTDGTKAKAVADLGMWNVQAKSAAIAVNFQELINPATAQTPIAGHLHVATLPVNPKKTVASFTLPTAPIPSIEMTTFVPTVEIIAATLTTKKTTAPQGPVFN